MNLLYICTVNNSIDKRREMYGRIFRSNCPVMSDNRYLPYICLFYLCEVYAKVISATGMEPTGKEMVICLNIYDIVLKTEIGDKKGKMVLNIDRNLIDGICTLLGFSEPCRGIIDEKGNCLLQGRLKNFMAVYDYIGSGHVDRSRINLMLDSGKKHFQIIGIAADQTEKQERKN